MRSQKDFCIILIGKQSKWKEYKLSRSTKKDDNIEQTHMTEADVYMDDVQRRVTRIC